jgi:site-specific DNA-methyltransferase (adenine-specific)
MKRLPLGTVLIGDVRERLAGLPDASVDCVITSPPYFRLRDYGISGQIGLEDTVDGWVDELRLTFRGLARVLKPTGSVWLNLGDSYSRHPRSGAPAKSLLLGPERLALALLADGWTVRNKVVWAKTNTMPTSVRDRLSCQWETLYLLTRSRHYFFDLDAIRVPHRSGQAGRRRASTAIIPTSRPSWAGPLAGTNAGLARLKANGMVGHRLGKNPGDVWTMASSNYRGAHFATFPESLVVRPLLASCPERVCRDCGEPWQREPARVVDGHYVRGQLAAGCACQAPFQPGVVLDPFMGAGTVGVVAARHRRDWLGIELNPEFAGLAMERIEAVGHLEKPTTRRRTPSSSSLGTSVDE